MFQPKPKWTERGREYTVCSVCNRLIYATDADLENGACCFCVDQAQEVNNAIREATAAEERAQAFRDVGVTITADTAAESTE